MILLWIGWASQNRACLGDSVENPVLSEILNIRGSAPEATLSRLDWAGWIAERRTCLKIGDELCMSYNKKNCVDMYRFRKGPSSQLGDVRRRPPFRDRAGWSPELRWDSHSNYANHFPNVKPVTSNPVSSPAMLWEVGSEPQNWKPLTQRK